MVSKPVWTVVGVVTVAALAFAGWQLFGPETSVHVDEALPDATPSDASVSGDSSNSTRDGYEVLKRGRFDGADRYHHVSGEVVLYEAPNGSHLLRFEDYEATNGPDVYLYLVRGDPSKGNPEGEAYRLYIPGGEGDGRATVRGTFNVALPAGLDPLDWTGVSVWCDRFDVRFGQALLSPA